MCPNQEDFGRGVTGLREDDYVCVKSCNGEAYIVTSLARIVKWCENPTGVGRGFRLSWARGVST